MHSLLIHRFWLITCLTLLGGLATAVPVNCICPADDHFGQMIHPLFPHYHGDVLHASDGAQPVVDSQSVSIDSGSPTVPLFDGSLLRSLVPWLALALMLAGVIRSEWTNRPAQQFPLSLTGPPRLALLTH